MTTSGKADLTEFQRSLNATDNSSSAYANSTVDHPAQYEYEQYEYDHTNFEVAVRALNFLREPPYAILASLSVVGIVSSIISIIAILIARVKTPYFRLILNLAISDLTISSSAIAYFIHTIVFPSSPWTDVPYNRCMFMFLKTLNNTGLIITLLTLMGMAIDQYIAILKPLHYHRLMSKRRLCIMILSLWGIAVICGFSDLLTGFPMAKKYPQVNYCTIVLYATVYNEEYIVFALAFLCGLVMLYIYRKIYQEVQRQKRRITIRQETLTSHKALITTLIILGTFLLCWLPLCLFEICMIAVTQIAPEYTKQHSRTISKVDLCLYDLVLLNTILDPLIYAIRMREVRISYQRLFCSCKRRPHPRRQSYLENNSHMSSLTASTNGSRKPSRSSLGSIPGRLERTPNLAGYPEGLPILTDETVFDPGLLENVQESTIDDTV